ncbi:response regulator transcription factor [Piscinibacter sp. XHJ-5]|uniref:response regulator transcription factor n=1 Tax=Piscinibacter sp. XHJ-5 TaxID=3037797 RepID=UPI00245302C1|nr:response regulator transcription factor [Piscinibacter sp. XHJ-5]
MELDDATVQRSPTASRGIRVFLADDHGITLWGLQRLIDASRPHLEVVGTAQSCEALISHPALPATDVLLLDLDLAGRNSTELMTELHARCSGQVLVLTAADDVADHRNAVLKGARGVLHKSTSADTILRAIESVHAGKVWMDNGLLGDVLGMLTGGACSQTPADPAKQRIASLTPREREIVTEMVRSAGSKLLAVADALHMSEHTLRNHLTTIYSKLGVRGRLELHVFSDAHGLGASVHRAPTRERQPWGGREAS